MKITVTVCDVCQDPEAPVTEYEIKSGDRKARVELCAPHGQPFEAYLTQSAKAPAPARQRPAKKAAKARTPRRNVTTMEEIEAAKAAGKV